MIQADWQAIHRQHQGTVCAWRNPPALAQVDDWIAGHTTPRDALRRIRLTLSDSACSVNAQIRQILGSLRAIAQADFPVWYDGIDFSGWHADPLSHHHLRQQLAALRQRLGGISSAWAERAVGLAAQGRWADASQPHDATAALETELAQLSCLLQPAGLILLASLPQTASRLQRSILTTTLEWCARQARATVVLALPSEGWLAPGEQDRWTALDLEAADAPPPPTLAPAGVPTPPHPAHAVASRVCGKPHGLSVVEQQVFRLLQADEELSGLFGCNLLIESARGYRARVDLLWPEGQVIIELDGHPDHSSPQAFERDRHRDYEWLINGYRVLRIANSEVLRDSASALEKIRDVVRFVRRQGG